VLWFPDRDVFLKLFGMNEATLMRGPPDGGKRSARTDNALHGAGADVGDPALCSDYPSDSCGAILLAVGGDVACRLQGDTITRGLWH